MRRLGVLIAILALLAACSSSGGSGSRQAFCARLKLDQKVLSNAEAADSQGIKRALREFDALADDAPAEIRGDMKVVQRLFHKLAKSDVKSLDVFGQIFASALDPQVIRATMRLNAYARDKCHVDLDTGAQRNEERPPGEATSPGVPNGTGGLDATAIRTYLDEHGRTAPWHGHVNGAGIASGDHETTVEIDTDYPADEGSKTTALDICRVASELIYGERHLNEVVLTVKDANNTALVERAGLKGSCSQKA